MKSDEAQEQIKAQIQELLSRQSVNYGELLSLTNELMECDNEKVRFTVDAGIISRLGEELVGKRDTAVAELIKNAYDADATIVDVIFVNANLPGGELIIEDNGSGMTREQLINGFMRLSSSDKIHNPISPIFQRTRAGQKGIGRFATQRLGTCLTIITQTQTSSDAIKVVLDWGKFESDKYLNTIESDIQLIPKVKEQGTILSITGLRDGWSDAYVTKIYRCVSTLLQPYPLSKTYSGNNDPGFKAYFYRDLKDDGHKILDEVSEITQFALAEIDTYVDDQGHAHWSLKCNKYNYFQEFSIGKDPEDESSIMEYVRGVHARIYDFIYEASLISGQKRKEIREIAEEQGGIRLYRKGFRVLPYGEKGDDWLGLDESARRRSIVAPHQNISFFGLVEINDEGAEVFEETSSREGLIQNLAYDELVSYLYNVIISAVLKVADLRGRKGRAGQKDWGKKNTSVRIDTALNELKSIFEAINSGNSSPDIREDTSSFYFRAKELIQNLIVDRKEEQDERQSLIDENNMLRVLAGSGLVIGEFIHEIKRFEPAFSADLSVLRKGLEDNPIMLKKTYDMDINLKSFKAYTSYFDRTISRNVIRELEPINVKEQVNAFYDSIQNDINRAHIDFPVPKYDGVGLNTIPMHPSEWMSILFNLYTNSKKALKDIDNKKIFVHCWKDNKNILLDFSDNGKGIPIEDRDNVFNAFYTTSVPVGSGDDAYSGTGLGLTIVRDIISSYNGTIEVVESLPDYKTTFRISLPSNI